MRPIRGHRLLILMLSTAMFLSPSAAAAPRSLWRFWAPDQASGPNVSGTLLPLDGSWGLVVDDAHHQVFVTGDNLDTTLVVMDFDGNIVTTISGEQGGAGMVLNPATNILYVAHYDGNVIDKIDTGTLSKAGTIDLGAVTNVGFLALAGGRLWMSYLCGGLGGLASIHLDGSGIRTFTGSNYPPCARFGTSAGQPDLLVAMSLYGSPTSIFAYDVSVAPPILRGSDLDVGGNGMDVTLTADGSIAITAAASPHSFQFLMVPSFSVIGSVPTGGFPIGVALTANGDHLATEVDSIHPVINVYPIGSTTPNFSSDLDGFRMVYDHSAAFNADASRLFVMTGWTSNVVYFYALDDPTAGITGFSPPAGRVGQAVTIFGSGFTSATDVSFLGVSAPFAVTSDTEIDATVPFGALTGPIEVTIPSRTLTSSKSFLVKPSIGSFSPTAGTVGTRVVIKGSAFTGATDVSFSGTPAPFVVKSYAKIYARVPVGATTGPITVTTPGGMAKSIRDFVVT
jgi:hypothetical protein